jgi:SAM-dependent methyltransferase
MTVLRPLKRVLRPVRPVLLPLWRRIRPFIEPSGGGPSDGVPRKVLAVGPTPQGVTPEHPIRPIAKREFEALARAFAYYRGRWGYISLACREAGDLIDTHGLTSALELGPHLRSIIVGADVMDRRLPAELEAEGQALVHDATKVPWPIEDKRFDLFVALQVFEHLGDRQVEAFAEVRRVARHAIISLPIDWVMDDPTNCHHQITNERALGWFHPTLPTRVVRHETERRKRLIYVFENL